MVDVKELRLGNWISDEIYGERQVDLGLLTYIINEKNSQAIPIKLTEEWLLKAGFVKTSGWDDYKGWVKDEVEIEDMENGTYMNYIDKSCNYIHSLQNLYHSLTGEELKFNK